MVRALQAAVHDGTGRQRRLAMRAAVEGGREAAFAVAPHDDPRAEQRDGKRSAEQVGGSGHRVPVTAEGRVGGERSVHTRQSGGFERDSHTDQPKTCSTENSTWLPSGSG